MYIPTLNHNEVKAWVLFQGGHTFMICTKMRWIDPIGEKIFVNGYTLIISKSAQHFHWNSISLSAIVIEAQRAERQWNRAHRLTIRVIGNVGDGGQFPIFRKNFCFFSLCEFKAIARLAMLLEWGFALKITYVSTTLLRSAKIVSMFSQTCAYSSIQC